MHIILWLGLIALGLAPHAQAMSAPQETLFRDVRVFDGVASRLSEPTDVLVRGNTIARIGARQSAPVARGPSRSRRRS